MKKVLALSLTVAMALGALTGCSSDGGETPASASSQPKEQASSQTPASESQGESQASGEVKTVTVWHLYGESEEPTSPHQRYLAWAEDFNSRHDDIKVEVSGGKTADVILTSIAAGTTPDIFMNYWNNALTWADAGAIMDLTEYVNNDTDWNKDDIMDAAWQLAEFNGTIYSIPNSFNTSMVFYRKDILKEAGWNEFPTTIEDLTKCIRDVSVVDGSGKIERLGLIPDYPWADMGYFSASFGASFLDKATNKITANEQEMIDCLQWQVDIYNDYGYSNIISFKDGLGARGTAEDPIFTGMLAMRWNDIAVLSNMEEFGKDIEWDMAALPSRDGNTGFYTGNVWEMNAKTADPDVTWEVLSDLTSEESYRKFAQGEYDNGSFFARKSALTWLKDEADVTERTKWVANYLLTTKLNAFPNVTYINEYLDILGTEVALTWDGSVKVEDALNNVYEQVQPLADAEAGN